MADDCALCFCPIEGKSVTCGNKMCEALLCDECFAQLLTHCVTKSIYPQCPVDSCKHYYLYYQIEVLGKEVVHNYNNVCMGALLKDKGEVVQREADMKVLFERLKCKRRLYVQSKFPKAIGLVASLAYKDRINRVARNVKDKLSNSKRRCMNLMCSGHLDDDLVCMLCSTRFCKDCEHEDIKNHKCDPNEVASVADIHDTMKCPNCKIAIYRSSGCSNMTCASCGQKFNYMSGEKGVGGSTNQPVELVTHSKLSSIYGKSLSTSERDLLLTFESLHPNVVKDQSLKNIVKRYTKEGDKIRLIAGKFFTAYWHSKYAIKHYIRTSVLVERCLTRGDKIEETLKKAIVEVGGNI